MKKLDTLIPLLFIYFSLTTIRTQAETLNLNSKGFEKNMGQIIDEDGNQRPDVYYSFHFGLNSIFLTNKGVTYYFRKIELSEYLKISSGEKRNPYSNVEWENIIKQINNNSYDSNFVRDKVEGYRIDITFPGANLSTTEAFNKITRENHYFHPNHPDGLYNVPIFEKVKYTNIYEGIDLVFYFNEGKLKYDFEVKVGADPSQIKIKYEGHQSINIEKNGDATITTLPTIFKEEKPISFQGQKEISTNFLLNNDTLMFHISDYDKTQMLIIDPAITWLTYFHDNSSSAGFTYSHPVWDSQNNMYFGYTTYNANTFPTVSPGGSSYHISTGGSTGLQLIILKFNAAKQIVWATYYASSQSCRGAFSGNWVNVDKSDNVYVVGQLSFVYASPTPSFPLYNPGGGAYYATSIGTGRTFILKFSSSGQRLWATMFHSTTTSSSGLNLQNITFDSSNRLIIAGYTYAGTWDPIPTANPGGSHYFKDKTSTVESQTPTLHRFSSSGALEWSTYISQGVSGMYNGSGEPGTVITVDQNNNIFMATQVSTSPSYSMTGWQTANPGSGAYIDANPVISVGNSRKMGIIKFNSSGQIVWSTLYGGTTISGTGYNTSGYIWTDPGSIGVNSNGDVFITGLTTATNFPTFDPGGGAYFQAARSQSASSWAKDAFIVKFTNNGNRQWATYYGNNNGTTGGEGTWLKSIGFDGSNNIYVAGYCDANSPFPTQVKTGSYNQASSNNRSLGIASFSSTGVRLWSTPLGEKTYSSNTGGGFGVNPRGTVCTGVNMVQLGYIENASSATLTPVNPGGSAYYNGSVETGTYTDFIAEFSTAPQPLLLANNNDTKTCPCAGNAYTHFIPDGTTRVIASINPNGQNLGNTTVTAYVQSAAVIVNDCNNTSPNFQTAVMGRRFKITPTTQPSSNVSVRLYFSATEFSNLSSASTGTTTANPNDNISTMSALKATRFSASAGNSAYENGNFPDNCGRGNFYLYNNVGTGNVTSLFTGFDANGRYAEFSVPGFSEMWLHGKIDNSPLPVELFSFSAACLEKGTRINWTTVSEQNNAYFQIDKSLDGENWNLVKRISGAGNSNNYLQYEVQDFDPNNGTTLYRLSQIDYDGTVTYFEPYSVTCTSSSSNMEVYPNPANAATTIAIQVMESATNAYLQITDAAGKTIFTQKINLSNGLNQFTIPTDHWADGIYVIRVIHDQLTIPAQKLLIRK